MDGENLQNRTSASRRLHSLRIVSYVGFRIRKATKLHHFGYSVGHYQWSNPKIRNRHICLTMRATKRAKGEDEALPACAFAIERRFGRRALFLLSDVSKAI